MAEYKITAVRTAADQDERDRRLNQVYRLLLDLAARREVAEQKCAGNEPSPATEDTMVAQG